MNQNEIAKLVTKYELKVNHVHKFSTGVRQLNYFVDTHKGRYVLKIYRYAAEKHPEVYINYELAVMLKLNALNLPVPKPVRNIKGSYITKQANKLAVLFEFIDGIHPKRLTNSCTKQVVLTLANMHKLTRNFKPSGWRMRNCVSKAHVKQLKSVMPKLIHKKWKCKQEEWKKLVTMTLKAVKIPKNLPKSNVHDDINGTNLLFKNGRLTAVLDFDMSYYGTIIYDIAALLEWCGYKHYKIDAEKLKYVLRTYNSMRHLTYVEKTHLWDAVVLNLAKRLIYMSGLNLGNINLLVERRLVWMLRHKRYFNELVKHCSL